MYDKLTYTNSVGSTIAFGTATSGKGILINENNVRDFAKKYDTKFDKIVFDKNNIVEKTLPVILFSETAAELQAMADTIADTIGTDIATNTQGKITIGDYYMSGYFIGAEKDGYTKNNDMKLKLTFVTNSPKWTKALSYDYMQQTIDTEYGKFPYKYPARYASLSATQTVVNYHYASSPIKIVFYGPCSSPSVLINGLLYKVNTEVADGEYLTIDGIEKTIVLTRTNGELVNVFNLQDRDFYIFSEIPAGGNTITWDGNFAMTLTIFEERSEPKWA